MAKTNLKRLMGSAAILALSGLSSVSRADIQMLGAPEMGVLDCDYSGSNHSKEVTSSDLVNQCRDVVLARASGPANRWSTDNSLHVFGFHGMLFIDHVEYARDGTPSVVHKVIAGRNVVFRNVDAVAIDESRREIFVLDASTRSISVYPFNETGDIYPKRKLVSDELRDASSLTIDAEHNELLVLSSSASSLVVFSRQASSDGRRPENSTAVKRKTDISGLLVSGSSFSDVAVAPGHNEAFVLDQGLGKVVSFDSRVARPAVKQLFNFSSSISGVQYIQYAPKTDSIRVVKSDGSGREYSVVPPEAP